MAATVSKKGPKANSENPTTAKTSGNVWFYSLLLTLQYGAQPLISKRFVRLNSYWELNPFFNISSGSSFWFDPILLAHEHFPLRREVIVTSSVLTCEVVKVFCALILMAKEGSLKKIYREWTLFDSLTASGLPAAIYALQNSLLQISYKNLDSLTFSILNQTKLFFTAFFTYIILRPCLAEIIDQVQKQSIQQIGALFLLIMAAVLLSVGEGSSKASSSNNPDEILFYGIVPVLVASVLSGLASALCQWASQASKHCYFMESTSKSPDGEAIKQHGFFYGWTALTLIPVILNAVGGILVGLVTSYAGGVRKGFVIVSALLVTALLQFMFDGKPPSPYCLVALPLVMISISIHQKFPYRVKKKQV
ncbi:hypothetical protein RND71_026099 [Anisodus tanguticus]|uniref:CMP-sialic acid transporter 5 n=1 Tax=Anisodus tanguticus TaxID=243964 RepID=A0AAE1VAZ6_9SOLA|nr:hypothetical protein RND71_026099 [Anisodus tanguticus]